MSAFLTFLFIILVSAIIPVSAGITELVTNRRWSR